MKITVLAGGASAERDVSLDSGANVAKALRERGHDVQLVDPGSGSVSDLNLTCDAIIPMLHGTGAEDGILQEDLRKTGIPWLGSSAEASRLTFDKIATRERLAAHGLPIPEGIVIEQAHAIPMIDRFTATHGFPVVLKPACQGSSVGVSIVRSPADLASAMNEVFRWGSQGLAERFIDGREVTVPVIDGTVFPAIEIIPARSWYDYTAKYSDDATQYVIRPANLPSTLDDVVRKACEVCGVTAISRTDLRITPAGELFILEINTIPGMTSHSLVPMSITAAGFTTGSLLEDLLRTELQKHQRPHNLQGPSRSVR
jgi:D-alanine-D-alanine ligase